jgi:cytochrome c oxidase subunit 2
VKAIFLALLLCSSAVVLFTPKGAAQDKPRRVEVVAKRWDFTPGEVSVKKGEPVTLALTSQDVDHGIKFKDLNVNVVAKKGKSNEVTFTPDKAGDFVGQCSVFCGSGHGAMHFTLHVTE